jgi:hypothetical protein
MNGLQFAFPKYFRIPSLDSEAGSSELDGKSRPVIATGLRGPQRSWDCAGFPVKCTLQLIFEALNLVKY